MRGNGWRLLGATGFVALASMVALGCSSPPPYPPNLPDEDAARKYKNDVEVVVDAVADAIDDGDATDAASDGPLPCDNPGDASCNGVTNCGQEVPVISVIGTAPTATGGTVADGTYVLTSYQLVYPMGTGGPTGTWIRETVVVKGLTLEIASETDTSPLANVNATIAYVPTNKLAYTYTCAGGPLTTVEYSFTPGTWTLLFPGTPTSVATYTKM